MTEIGTTRITTREQGLRSIYVFTGGNVGWVYVGECWTLWGGRARARAFMRRNRRKNDRVFAP